VTRKRAICSPKKYNVARSILCGQVHSNLDPSQAIQLVGQKKTQVHSQSSKKQQAIVGSNHSLKRRSDKLPLRQPIGI